MRHSHLSNVVAAVALIGNASFAAISTVPATGDAFVTTGASNNLRDNNYGAAGALAVSAPGSANGEFQSVLRFDLASAQATFNALFGPGQWTVQSISLDLTATSPNNAIFNANAAGTIGVSWMQNDSWIEGSGGPNLPSTTGISYNSLQNALISPGDQSLGTFNYNGNVGLTTHSLTVSAGLLGDIQSGSVTSMRLFASDSGVSYLANSRNFPTAASRPVLTIDAIAVPEPGAAVLGALLIAAFGVARFVRRR